jgi:hypothetical protein
MVHFPAYILRLLCNWCRNRGIGKKNIYGKTSVFGIGHYRCVCVYVCVYACVYMYVCIMHVCMYVCMYECIMHVCMYVLLMYVCIMYILMYVCNDAFMPM